MSEAGKGRAALLVMDMQNAIVSSVEHPEGLLERTGAAIARAREVRVPVFFVVVRFRPGMPEVSARNLGFSRAARSGIPLGEDDAGTRVHDALGRRDSEPLVVKRRVSAFAGSDLKVLLSAADADHLVLAGIATSGVVLSTVRLAADLDYRLTVLGDCCADRDPDVHRILLERVFPSQAAVVDVADWTP